MKNKAFIFTILVMAMAALSACSTNRATGKQQFTAFMSPQQELQIGAQEHQKIIAQYGLYDNAKVQAYVNGIGQRVAKNTENPNVQYKFYVLDSPVVNAFALPGGYVYISRGLLALANSESELAAVLGHEIGHITGRHTAERYSRGTLASLGVQVISMAVNTPGAGEIAGLGANLYLSSYSRGQESEADSLGLRYMSHTHYDVNGMGDFLESMRAQDVLDKQLAGKKASDVTNYFSTHPATAHRVADTRAQAQNYPKGGAKGRDTYLKAIKGITYGDSAEQGFVRGQTFIHPQIGFQFDTPQGFRIQNTSSAVVAFNKSSGAAIIYDMHKISAPTNVRSYMAQLWLKGKAVNPIETSVINGMQVATTVMPGTLNGRKVDMRLLAIAFKNNNFARFKIAIPKNASPALVNALKTASYSFRKLTSVERNAARPARIKLVAARGGDTPATMAARMSRAVEAPEARFRVLNGLAPNETLVAGRLYKIVVN
jgi:predicted Zn-dependent protease